MNGEAEFLTALNLTHEPRMLTWLDQGTPILSTYLDDFHPTTLRGLFLLRPDEGLLIKLAG